MADVITGNTQLSSTKQDIIAAIVQKELAFQAKLLPTVTDVSQFAIKGAKSISFPKLTSFTVVNRTSGSAGDASALTASVDQLLLDKNAYIAWIIDSFDEVQTSIEAQIEFARRAAAAHARYVDEQIIAELDLVASLNINAGVPADITRDNVLELREHLLSNDAERSALTLVLPPDQESAMLKIAEFSRSDYYGSSNIPAGMIGQVYGVPVFVHNGVEAQQAYMYDKSGIALGFQKAPAMSSQPANEYGTGAERHAMDQLFGVKGLQLGQKGVGAAESALVAKLKD